MLETLKVLPAPFWVAAALIASGLVWSAANIRRALGIPAAAVLATIAVWYAGDALYNDYVNTHLRLFTQDTLATAWWQVVWFLAVFLFATGPLHKRINHRLLDGSSRVLRLFQHGVSVPRFQRALTTLFFAAAGVWLLVIATAVFRYQARFPFYFFPYLGQHPGPWATTGLAGGRDTVFALANYLQLMVGSIFGVVAALSTNPRLRLLALTGVFLTWPFYIFDRTRKFILAIALPGLLGWVLLRLRGGLAFKGAVLLAAFLVVNAWFGFIIGHRAESAITSAFRSEGFGFSASSKEPHQGLNMLEELAWIISLKSDGVFNPGIGGNYFANLVNPIPRFLWPGKPTIGIDYAIARGLGGADAGAGVYATLSDGMIGQGVVNFGLYLGPAFAGLLMSLWVCWLARLDLAGDKIGFIPLYGLGLILTFTMGRDITFLELYPFVFGYAICWWLNRSNPSRARQSRRAPAAGKESGERSRRRRPGAAVSRRPVG